MFETVTEAPPDAIFGLNEAMRRDPRSDKINLGAGVYKDKEGQTPVLRAVRRAAQRLLEKERSKTYLPIDGLAEYDRAVHGLLFGADHPAVGEGRVTTAQAPGGTGALRIAGDFLKRAAGARRVWLSDPTWPNHPQVFEAVGLPIERYGYFDRGANGLDEAGLLADLGRTEPGDVVLLHGCCHNPTGIDPSPGQWAAIGALLAERGALPLVDFAYQGFAEGVEADVGWLRILEGVVPELVVCNSFSKNFGLYNERVGALSVISPTADVARAVRSQVKATIRANYSNPPAHGARLVSEVLGDPELESEWRAELSEMRERIRRMRRLFAAGLDARGVELHPSGNGFIARQNGMFSFSRLGREQVARLRDEAAIYIVDSGRINVAGMSEATMDRLCDAVAAVL